MASTSSVAATAESSADRKDRHLQYLTVTRAYRQGRIASALAMSFVVLLELVTGHRPSGYCEPEPPPAIWRQRGAYDGASLP